MKRLIAGSVFVLLLVVGALGAVGYAKYRQIQAASSMPPPPEMPVAVASAAAVDQPYRRNSVVIGTVLASQSVTLSNELTGVVTEVGVKPGDLVRRGDVLFRFDTELESAELKSALATRKLAEDALARNERLKRSGAGSEQLLEEATADLSRSIAEVERLEALINKKTLRAPFDARVGLFDLHPGQYLAAGSEITELSGLDDYLNIDFAMPQAVAASVGAGDTVELLLSGTAGPLESKIIAVDASANLQSRSLLARARLDQPPTTLHPGDSVKVRIPYGPQIPAVTVPSTAIRRGPTGTTVFVAVESEGQLRAESRAIVVLGSDGSRTWIADGVTAGDTVITDGSFKVSEGRLLATGDTATGGTS
ncbi:efflux RND transporter periplasmic adaptor subunit [Stieleria mannarensis]|uniref:efflux RND transporter periplasmic adaptor subunit n=1 Tax=Stieleria mannarensis TaxID=2755585 RepID=UPI0016029181|nr:efflux RND transporter periplasmic adaptor subunit [Rhodopirellula sp. JC639]